MLLNGLPQTVKGHAHLTSLHPVLNVRASLTEGGASLLVIGDQQARSAINLAREWKQSAHRSETLCTDREIAEGQAEKARAFTSLLATHQCIADRIKKVLTLAYSARRGEPAERR